MPAFRRDDAAKWRKWRFYLGAITLLVPRLILQVIAAFIMIVVINILLICHDKTKPIENGCRKGCLKVVCSFGARLFVFIIYFGHLRVRYVSKEDVNYYEEWLGTRE